MKRKPYRYFLYLGLRFVQGVVSILPRKAALVLGEGLGRLAFLLAVRERKRTLRHLSWAFGEEKGPNEIWELGQRVFAHFARMAVDILRLPKLTRAEADRLIDQGKGLSVINRLLSEGRGVILLTAHFGNWEMLGAFLRLHHYQGALIGRRIYYEKFNEMILCLRESLTLRTIYQDASPREFLKVLNQNQILGILADQDIDRFDGIFIPFFGRPAYTLTAPAKLALASGAPILLTFLVRKEEGYQLLVEEPLYVEMKGSREETIHEYTARWSHIVEEKIRAYPDQWAWMHRRWKTPPSPERVETIPFLAEEKI